MCKGHCVRWPVRIFKDFPISLYIVAASESDECLVYLGFNEKSRQRRKSWRKKRGIKKMKMEIVATNLLVEWRPTAMPTVCVNSRIASIRLQVSGWIYQILIIRLQVSGGKYKVLKIRL